MKFIVSTQSLLKSLQQISGVIGTNNVLPILEDFLFDIEKGTLKIVASDLETSMSTSIAVESNENGRIAIPAKLLLETLKTLPEQPLTFTIHAEDGLSVEITSSNGKYKLSGENADDFPKLPQEAETSEIKIPAKVLSRAINQTIFAVSNDEMRPAMTGVYMQLDPDGTTFVATDAQKLVRYKRRDIKSENSANFILPRKALGLLKGSLPDDESIVTISFNNSNAYFKFGSVNLICRLIEGRYPDYNAVIPMDNPNLLVINRTDLQNSLKRTSIFSNKTTYQVVLTMAGSELKVSAKDIDFSNEAQENLFCNYNGDDLTIGFNSKYLIEMLGVLNTEDIKGEFSISSRAGVITPTEMDENEDLLMLIMPIMLNA
ncbi:MAG: DNA polymerase III subunit beta [Bacteroidetes bacterium]|nr:DNA polymerase III subunit beta [Bacteroidota bacterium]MBP7478560.1 DNA polymerase III subunit beta [Chitinophagales bacterium]